MTSESPAPRLLVLSCSRRKRPNVELLPALGRYDGPLFQIVRKYQRESGQSADALNVFVLSASLGLISGYTTIPNYDRRMTQVRAAELHSQVLEELSCLLHAQQYQEMCIAMGRHYLSALEGYARLVPENVKVTVCNGSYGKQQATLHRWLYGSKSPPCHLLPQEKVNLRGIEIAYSPEQILSCSTGVSRGLG